MGRYISLNFRFSSERLRAQIFEPIFATEFFTPVAIGGLESRNGGDNWFLAGYALEDFVTRFSTTAMQPTASIRVPAGPQVQVEYLQTIARDVSIKNPAPDLSPFETKDTNAGVTFLKTVRQDVSVLRELDQWLQEFPNSVVYLYGTFPVSVTKPEELPWSRSFRFFLTSELGAAPFLFMRASLSPFVANTIEFSIYSESTIWLQEAHSLNGLVAKEEAHKNLLGFSSLARTLHVAHEPLSVELQIDGGLFVRETDRLKLALTDVLNGPSRSV